MSETIEYKINDKIHNKPKSTKKTLDDRNFIIPSIDELSNIKLYNYKLPELKKICRFYKISNYSKMNKSNLIDSIGRLCILERSTLFIQKNIKRFNVQQFLNNKAPNKSWFPSKRKTLCKNESDFYTLENVDEIPLSQYICYVDENNCYWGFNILSLYNYFKHQYSISKIKHKINNPYTNLPFNVKFIDKFNHHIQISNNYGFTIELDIEDTLPKSNSQQVQELLVTNISIIEQHGYFLRNEWLSDISKPNLIKFMRELIEIWDYRSQINDHVKKQIYHPSGDPFEAIQHFNVLYPMCYDDVFKICLTTINNFISRGVTYSDCETGILFVLSALSLVSDEFAAAYPWIYAQSHY
jgi:hypothetical protein